MMSDLMYIAIAGAVPCAIVIGWYSLAQQKGHIPMPQQWEDIV